MVGSDETSSLGPLPIFRGELFAVSFWEGKSNHCIMKPIDIPSLKLTAKAPEYMPSQKKISSSNHPFSGATLVWGG